jgi:SAM-dependent methyltransferase
VADPGRPAHLTAENAAAFQVRSVVDGYHRRLPYPPELTGFLLDLSAGGAVLDLGCGTGEIARALAPHVDRVDAVDISAPMLEAARAMPGGDHTSIRWLESAVEDFEYAGPYGLAVAGASLHWMDWERVLPALARALAPGAPLALVDADGSDVPWRTELEKIIPRYSVMQDFEPYELTELLVQRGLFRELGRASVGAQPFEQSIDELLAGLHSTAGFVRERMGEDRARAFDDEVRRAVRPHVTNGALHVATAARVVWGQPLEGESP